LKALTQKIYCWSAVDIFRGYESASYMKVIGSRSRSQEQKSAKFRSTQCKTLMGVLLKITAVRFARTMGFSYGRLNGVTAIYVTWTEIHAYLT